MGMHVEYVSVPGARLWTACQGSGPAVVLLHGGPGMWDYLGPVAAMIDDLATVYRYDQRGCGRSSSEPPYDVTTAVADLDALREHWGVEEWVVAGHSWGATLALTYCLEHPDRARAMLYLSGAGIDPAWRDEFHGNLAAILGPEGQREMELLRERLATVEGEDRSAASRELTTVLLSAYFADRTRGRELARSLFIEDLELNNEVNAELGEYAYRLQEVGELRERLSALRIPVLVLHGEADPLPVWTARELAAILPNTELRVLPSVGHLPWLERPVAFRDTIRRFLASVFGAYPSGKGEE